MARSQDLLPCGAPHPRMLFPEREVEKPTVLIGHIVVILGGIVLGLHPFLPSGRRRADWIRRALLLAGIFGVLWSLMSILITHFPEAIPDRAMTSARNLKSGFGGAMAGLIFYLMLFKDFWHPPIRTMNKPKKALGLIPARGDVSTGPGSSLTQAITSSFAASFTVRL
jgi:hypothetical protein